MTPASPALSLRFEPHVTKTEKPKTATGFDKEGDLTMASKTSKHHDHSASGNSGGLSPVHVGVIVTALILVIGLAYVFASQPNASKPGSTAVPSSTASPTGTLSNATLPKEAALTGKASCSNHSKIQVLLFTDPYCPACVASDPQVSAFYQKYQGKADIQYLIVSTHSRSLSPVYGIDTVYAAHDYFVCAQEQGKFQQYKQCFYANLTLQNGDYIPETKVQLQACAQSIGLNQTQLDTCLIDARAQVDAADVQAANFGGGSFFTPMAVVDCQVRVNSALVEPTYCAVSKAC